MPGADHAGAGRDAPHDLDLHRVARPELDRRESDGRVRLQVLVDTTSVEVFGNGGLSVITANTFAPATARGWNVVEAKDNDGKSQPVSVRVWRMKSAWKE